MLVALHLINLESLTNTKGNYPPKTKVCILRVVKVPVNPEIGKWGREEEVVAARTKEAVYTDLDSTLDEAAKDF
jgi:hypothetical protein